MTSEHYNGINTQKNKNNEILSADSFADMHNGSYVKIAGAKRNIY